LQIQFQASITAGFLGIPGFGDGLAVFTVGGRVQLLYDLMPSGGAAVLTLSTGGTASASPSWLPDSDFSLVPVAGIYEIYSYIGAGAPLRAATLNPDGSLSASRLVTMDGAALNNVTELSTYTAGDNAFAVLATWGNSGLSSYRIGEGSIFTPISTIVDTDKSYIADVSDTLSLRIGGADYLLTASAGENGITMFKAHADGTLELHDSLGTKDGLSVNGPTALAVVEAWGQTFAVVGATLSNSISMVRINPMGCLFLADHQIDDGTTRFARVAALDTFSANGRSFVVAAGNDGGITIFEVLPGGELAFDTTYESTALAPLGTVTGIEAVVIGAEVHLYLVQANRTQITELTVSLANLGGVLQATGGVLSGTAKDDLILGSAGNDDLRGGLGNDRIVDGDGQDTLRGNGGADIFVFRDDEFQDTIMDFQMGIDRIDLSDWGMVYSLAELEIIPIAGGAEIRFEDHSLIVIASHGRMLTAVDFQESYFIF